MYRYDPLGTASPLVAVTCSHDSVNDAVGGECGAYCYNGKPNTLPRNILFNLHQRKGTALSNKKRILRSPGFDQAPAKGGVP